MHLHLRWCGSDARFASSILINTANCRIVTSQPQLLTHLRHAPLEAHLRCAGANAQLCGDFVPSVARLQQGMYLPCAVGQQARQPLGVHALDGCLLGVVFARVLLHPASHHRLFALARPPPVARLPVQRAVEDAFGKRVQIRLQLGFVRVGMFDAVVANEAQQARLQDVFRVGAAHPIAAH